MYEGQNIEFQVVASSSSKTPQRQGQAQKLENKAASISLKEILSKAANEDDYSQYILLTDSIVSALMLVLQPYILANKPEVCCIKRKILIQLCMLM